MPTRRHFAPSRPARAVARGLALALPVALVVVGAPPAGAHGGPGELAVTGGLSDDGTTVHLEATITYLNDGEAAERALVEVSGTAADGATTPAVDLVPSDVVGTYVADVPVPPTGEWAFLVLSTFPPATASFPVSVDATGAVDVGLPAPVGTPGADDDGGGRGVLTWVAVGVVAGLAAVGAMGLAKRLRGTRGATPAAARSRSRPVRSPPGPA